MDLDAGDPVERKEFAPVDPEDVAKQLLVDGGVGGVERTLSAGGAVVWRRKTRSQTVRRRSTMLDEDQDQEGRRQGRRQGRRGSHDSGNCAKFNSNHSQEQGTLDQLPFLGGVATDSEDLRGKIAALGDQVLPKTERQRNIISYYIVLYVLY